METKHIAQVELQIMIEQEVYAEGSKIHLQRHETASGLSKFRGGYI